MISYEELVNTPSDINEHLETLKEYATNKVVTEFWVREWVSTTAFLQTCKSLTSYDNHITPRAEELQVIYKDKFTLIRANTLEVQIEQTDILFIDTLHTAPQLHEELKQADKVRDYIILHDTVTYGEQWENWMPWLMVEVMDFLKNNPERSIKEHRLNNNWLLILERIKE